VQPLSIRTALVALAILGASGAAQASHVGVGIYVAPGGLYYPAVPGPYYYPAAPVPYYYPQPMAAPPDNYVEQGQQQQPAAAPGPDQDNSSWYYCDASQTYYPYVKQCAAGWRQVPAQPPSN
jgi:hypothetical protein